MTSRPRQRWVLAAATAAGISTSLAFGGNALAAPTSADGSPSNSNGAANPNPSTGGGESSDSATSSPKSGPQAANPKPPSTKQEQAPAPPTPAEPAPQAGPAPSPVEWIPEPPVAPSRPRPDYLPSVQISPQAEPQPEQDYSGPTYTEPTYTEPYSGAQDAPVGAPQGTGHAPGADASNTPSTSTDEPSLEGEANGDAPVEGPIMTPSGDLRVGVLEVSREQIPEVVPTEAIDKASR